MVSSAAEAVAAELIEKRQLRIDIGKDRDEAQREVEKVLALRRDIDARLIELGRDIEALEKALALIDPENDKH